VRAVAETASPDERAAVRAFLQRCEVRLSTMHRVATALLSGAGILVLLPAVERDAVLQVLRSLLSGDLTWSRGLLVAAVAISIVLALVVLLLVVVELTRFYFHSNHVRHADGDVFTPRFTLTGLRLPSDELGAVTDAAYESVHASDDAVHLLVPGNARARVRIDRQLAAYPGLGEGDDDRARADALFELAASRRRSLVEEAVKVEHGMVRHMLRLQVIVLRYVKALMVIVVTAIASFACAAAVSGDTVLTRADQRWIAGAMLLWSPVVLFAVAAPVRWLESMLRADGAVRSGVGSDPELTQLEDVTSRLAVGAWAVSAAAMLLLLGNSTVPGRVAGIVALVGSFAMVVVALLLRRRAHGRPA